DLAITEAGNVRIMITHGDQYDVKHTTGFLIKEGISQNADLIIFGHTHIPYLNDKSDPVLLNPGSMKAGSYATVIIDDKGIRCDLKEIG
ncbi:MAG TPA: metallophosphoesterase family protein, partial [Spirochaetota bacterium]